MHGQMLVNSDNNVADGEEPWDGIIRDLDIELLFKAKRDVERVKRVGAKVFHQVGGGSQLISVHAKLGYDYALYGVLNSFHSFSGHLRFPLGLYATLNFEALILLHISSYDKYRIVPAEAK